MIHHDLGPQVNHQDLRPLRTGRFGLGSGGWIGAIRISYSRRSFANWDSRTAFVALVLDFWTCTAFRLAISLE
ncbi:MAG: hypothetical protein WKF75_04910 [Singulisphaera sp.]